MKDLVYYSSTELENSWITITNEKFHSLHSLSSYKGQFPPSLVRFFIEGFSKPDDYVLDPFCGSGTTPLEALLLGRNGIGNDAFLVAKVITSAKLNPISLKAFQAFLFDKKKQVEQMQAITLNNMKVADLFHEKTLKELLKYRDILKSDNSIEGNFLKAIICSVLQGSTKKFLTSINTETEKGKVKKNEKQIKKNQLEFRSVYDLCLEKAMQVLHDPVPSKKGRFIFNDARKIALPDESIDLIVTSPPYMNDLDYSWHNWLKIWFLGEIQKDIRKKLTLTTDREVWENFMIDSLKEMFRVLKPNKCCIIIVGDVIPRQIRKKEKQKQIEIYNSALHLSEIADKIGLTTICIINDKGNAKNKHLLERCLILSKDKPDLDFKNLLKTLGCSI